LQKAMTTEASIEQAICAIKEAVKDVKGQFYVQAHMNLEAALAALEGRPYAFDKIAIRERIAELTKLLEQ
jgi:hypothetical protein